jgi:hypothetical protein
MKIETVKKLFECLYPEVKIVTIEVIPRNQYVDGNWIEDTPSIFVGIRNYENTKHSDNLSETLTQLTNREFNVFLT